MESYESGPIYYDVANANMNGPSGHSGRAVTRHSVMSKDQNESFKEINVQ